MLRSTWATASSPRSVRASATPMVLRAPVLRLRAARAHGLVMLDRLRAASQWCQEIPETLAHGALLVERAGLLKRPEGPLVVAGRVLVGVDGARPIARRHQVARAPTPVGPEAPVVAERL